MKQLNIQKIIEEAEKLGLEFTEEDAQDVIDTKPSWAKFDETEAEEAKELASDIYSDVDLSTLSQYELSGNDYLNKIVECD
jgi:hypothetical protein